MRDTYTYAKRKRNTYVKNKHKQPGLVVELIQ